MKKKALFIAIPLALGLTACGGGATDSNGSSLVSIMVTDAISTQYTKVWVKIQKITITDANGNPVTLFDDPAGRVFNLTELRGVSNLLDLATLTPGTYTDPTITMDPAVTLNDASNQPIQAQLAQTTITVPGSITITAGQTSLGIDFDLANFSYDMPTGTVTPSIVVRDHAAMQRLAQAFADLDGTIRSVTDATGFVMTTRAGQDVQVSLLANATVLVPNPVSTSNNPVNNGRMVIRDTSGLAPGQPVEVFGNYDPTALTIDAVRVRVGRTGGAGPALDGRDRVEGLATLTGNQLSLDVREASFVPPSTQLPIDLSGNGIVFEKGTRGDLTQADAPLDVELYGNWDGSVFTAVAVRIEGARPHPGGNNNVGTTTMAFADQFVEVKGRLAQDYDSTAQTMTVDILRSEHVAPTVTMPQTLTVDLSGAWFKHGNSGCLTKDAFVELKGALTDTQPPSLAARMVKLESACSFSGQPVADIVVDTGDTPAMRGGNRPVDMAPMPEVRGLIQAVDTVNRTLTLEIIHARGLRMAQGQGGPAMGMGGNGPRIRRGEIVTIDYSGSVLFDRGTEADLAAQRLIVVEGSQWQPAATPPSTPTDPVGTLTAARIDFI